MLRHARNVISVLCAVAPLVLIPMWVRSYHSGDTICMGLIGHRTILVASKEGRVATVYVGPDRVMDSQRWTAASYPITSGATFPVGHMRDYEAMVGFGWIAKPDYVLDFDASSHELLTWTRIPAGSLPTGSSVKVSDQTTGSYATTNVYLADGFAISALGTSGGIAHAVFGLPGAGPLVPYWFLLLLSGAGFVLTRLRRPWRFSLQTLLVAMTYAAAILTLVAILDR